MQFIKGGKRSQQLSEVRTVACSQVHLSRIATYTAFRGFRVRSRVQSRDMSLPRLGCELLRTFAFLLLHEICTSWQTLPIQFDAAECREHPGAHPSAECEERCPTDRRFLEVFAVCCQPLHEKVYQHVIRLIVLMNTVMV